MTKDPNNKPRKKNETQNVEEPIMRTIEAIVDNPGPNAPNRRGGCPSGGGGGGSAVGVRGANDLPPLPPQRRGGRRAGRTHGDNDISPTDE